MRLSHPPLLFPAAFPLVSLRDTKYPTAFSASTILNYEYQNLNDIKEKEETD